MNLPPKEKMKMEITKIYMCPMHTDVIQDKSGKCPNCGMDLKETENSTNLFLSRNNIRSG